MLVLHWQIKKSRNEKLAHSDYIFQKCKDDRKKRKLLKDICPSSRFLILEGHGSGTPTDTVFILNSVLVRISSRKPVWSQAKVTFLDGGRKKIQCKNGAPTSHGNDKPNETNESSSASAFIYIHCDGSMSVSVHVRAWQCVGAVSDSQQLIFSEWVCVYFISIDRQAAEVNRLSRMQWSPKTFFK